MDKESHLLLEVDFVEMSCSATSLAAFLGNDIDSLALAAIAVPVSVASKRDDVSRPFL
jgi:hypothetical protein